MEIRELLNKLQEVLPRGDILVGYGSSFVRQTSKIGSEESLRDILIFTNNRKAFVNRLYESKYISPGRHYFSLLVDPEILYYAEMHLSQRFRLKIGIVNTDRALQRMSDWENSFYIPGRFQKPVRLLQCEDKVVLDRFERSRAINYESALAAALLLKSSRFLDRFSISDVFTSLVSLSYLGDVRMGFAENPRKVENIVSAQTKELMSIYFPYFAKVGIEQLSETEFACRRRPDDLWLQLPQAFTRRAVQHVDPRKSLIATITRINRRESINQALIGVGTTGISKSLQYLARKVSKRFLYSVVFCAQYLCIIGDNEESSSLFGRGDRGQGSGSHDLPTFP